MGNEQSSPSSSTSMVDPSIPRSNLRKNHDDSKVRHKSYAAAAKAKENMQRKNKPGQDRLTTYYNEDTKGYYNGRRKETSSSSSRSSSSSYRSSSNISYDDSNRNGSGDGLILISMALYGVYCAGSWAVNQAMKAAAESNNDDDDEEDANESGKSKADDRQ
mmetsp:Transcript_24777/g.34617  ORF Transcript_24777/g.34617 Transcript_24777/m.34617 type:complete len:161 (-) Transcript_24777:57-539(-)